MSTYMVRRNLDTKLNVLTGYRGKTRRLEKRLRTQRVFRVFNWVQVGVCSVLALAYLLWSPNWISISIFGVLTPFYLALSLIFGPRAIRSLQDELREARKSEDEQAHEVQKAAHRLELAEWQEKFNELLRDPMFRGTSENWELEVRFLVERGKTRYFDEHRGETEVVDLTDWEGDDDPRRQWAQRPKPAKSGQRDMRPEALSVIDIDDL